MADGRGSFMVSTWQELKKAGGIAFSPEQLDALLLQEDDKMLTREEVENRIRSYFLNCTKVEENEDGELVYVWAKNPTKSGLALALGISVGTLCDYIKGSDRHGNPYKITERKNPQRINTSDFDLLHRAYQLIESFYEEKLADNRNNAGTIYWLNNRNNQKWSNEQEFKFGQAEQDCRVVLSVTDLPKLSNMNSNQFDLPTLEVTDDEP